MVFLGGTWQAKVNERMLKSEQEAPDRRVKLTAILILGVTFPSGEMQQQLVRSLYRECGIKPEEVEYVEAHGTGTKVSMVSKRLSVFFPCITCHTFPLNYSFSQSEIFLPSTS